MAEQHKVKEEPVVERIVEKPRPVAPARPKVERRTEGSEFLSFLQNNRK